MGRIFAVDLTVKNYRDPSYYESDSYRGTRDIDGGRSFMMQAVHHVDLYRWFFGKPSRVISSYGTFTHDIDVEDHGAGILKHDNDMIGTIIAPISTRADFERELGYTQIRVR